MIIWLPLQYKNWCIRVIVCNLINYFFFISSPILEKTIYIFLNYTIDSIQGILKFSFQNNSWAMSFGIKDWNCVAFAFSNLVKWKCQACRRNLEFIFVAEKAKSTACVLRICIFCFQKSAKAYFLLLLSKCTQSMLDKMA